MPRAQTRAEAIEKSGICHHACSRAQSSPVNRVMPSVATVLDMQRPDWRTTGRICRRDPRKERQKAIEHRLRSKSACRVSRDAEFQIRHYREIIEHYLTNPCERLSPLQETQLEMVDKVTRLRRK